MGIVWGIRQAGWRPRWLVALAGDDSAAPLYTDQSKPHRVTPLSCTPESFATFFQRHEQALFGYLRRMTGEEQAAYDLSQDAFVRAWEHFDALRRYDNPRAWLFRVATNLALNHLRNQQRHATEALLAEDDRMVGNTLYWGVEFLVQRQPNFIMWEYDGVGLVGGVTSKQIFHLAGDPNQYIDAATLEANGRLFAWRGGVTLGDVMRDGANFFWDRAQQREVQIEDCVYCPYDVVGFSPPFIRGNTLVYATLGTNQTTFSIIDTTTLRH